jgi:hypothetical protein
MSSQVSIQEVLKNYNQRIIKLEKLTEAQEKFDLVSFQSYVDKIDEMCTFIKKQQWELGHTCNTLENRVNELTMLLGNVMTKQTNFDENNLEETKNNNEENVTLKVSE